MMAKFCLFLILVSCVTVMVNGQANSLNCGPEGEHHQMSVEQCEALYEGKGACLQPGSCNNDVCQKKCYLCECIDKAQCRVRGSGANEEVYCDCSLSDVGTGYGPYCISECDENGGCVGSNIHCNLHNFTCMCNAGYRFHGGVCVDIDECHNSPCPAGATCENLPGSYTCHCPYGSYNSESNTCPSDVNECEDGSHQCDANAFCTDLPDGYSCTCNPGWEGNGFKCVDVNECVVEINGGCGEEAYCVNTAGSYLCHCFNPGLQWNGFGCEDIDECAVNNGGCNNALCINTEGSRVCMCQCGLAWNGAFCTSASGCGGGCDGGAPCYPLFPGFPGTGGKK